MIIKKFTIIDFKHKEAASFDFSEGINILISDGNTKGKSSLLKSMYYTLGFDIKQFPSKWNIEEMIFQLEVEIEKTKYVIIRQKDIYKVNSVNKHLNGREYSNWLQEKLKINMLLPNVRTKSLFSAYSSAIILPFYIDQDDSWDGILYKRVSDTLNQYKDIPKAIFEYLFSISNIEIQELKNKLNNEKKILEESKKSIESLNKVVAEYITDFSSMNIAPIDKEALQNEIDFYLKALNKYNKSTIEYKIKLINKQEKLDMYQQDLEEIKQLLKLNRKRVQEINSTCKYCKSNLTVEQSLTRLNLSNNEFEMEVLLAEIKTSIEKSRKEIKELILKKEDIENEIKKLKNYISKSKELLTIDDYVSTKAKNIALKEIQGLCQKEILKKEKIEQNIKELNKDIREIKSKKKELTESINVEYQILINEINLLLPKADLSELDFLEFKKISGSGMDKNQKYLGYYLVYLTLIEKYGLFKIPYCMDSFIKNEISGETASQMFKAIEKYLLVDNNQSFFSVIKENLSHLDKVAKYYKVEIGEKLLSSEDYETLKSTIMNFE